MSKLNNKIAFLDDYWNSEGIDFNEMFIYVTKHKDFNLEMNEFFIIESGFREKWNKETGKIVGDGDFKNAIYRYIKDQINNGNSEFIEQEKVDSCIDLILNYLVSIGQWYNDFSKS